MLFREFQRVFGSILRTMTRKVVNYFGEEKCTPRQHPGYAYADMLV